MNDNNELIQNVEKHKQTLAKFREDYISELREFYSIDFDIEKDFDLKDKDFLKANEYLTLRYLGRAIFYERRVLELIHGLENADKEGRHNIISSLKTLDSDARIHQEEMRDLLVLIGECYDRISEARNLANMENYPYANKIPETAIEVLRKGQDNGLSLESFYEKE